MTTKMRVRLAPSVAEKFDGLTPTLKTRAVAAVLTAATEQVDVVQLLQAVEQLRGIGVNLNQLTRLSHKQGEMSDAVLARVSEYLDFLDRIRGRT